ncbi:hypothetical protein V496_09868 [Pseudogymnoascus sp. VKM F-4515 (FW-2607)]|nr:hypothetical protein V496_09868 [Pseudogymnoascus sp. VKM F-4515 (FW-2607)]
MLQDGLDVLVAPKVPDLTFSEPFTIYWEPTTEGTVTVTIVTLDNNNFDVGDFAIIGIDIPNSGSLTTTFNGYISSSPISCGVKIVSDSSDPPSVTYSNVFEVKGPTWDGSNYRWKGDDDADTTYPVTVTAYTTVSNDIPAPTDPLIPTSPQPPNSDGTTADAPIADITAGSSLTSESSASSSTGLSTGAKVGIGMGVTLGALILLGIGGFYWRMARKRPFGPEIDASASALEAVESKNMKRASELEGTGVIPAEIQGTPRAELE